MSDTTKGKAQRAFGIAALLLAAVLGVVGLISSVTVAKPTHTVTTQTITPPPSTSTSLRTIERRISPNYTRTRTETVRKTIPQSPTKTVTRHKDFNRWEDLDGLFWKTAGFAVLFGLIMIVTSRFGGTPTARHAVGYERPEAVAWQPTRTELYATYPDPEPTPSAPTDAREYQAYSEPPRGERANGAPSAASLDDIF
ncbi:hypothetical protein ABQE48_16465 [Mycolicibacterium thermoresistibile]